MSWILWGVMLLAQNASFTWVSRARNSKSLGYHAIASVCSNGIWFASLSVAVDKLKDADTTAMFVITALFYTTFTVVGSVSAHHLLQTRVEKGDRRPLA